MLSTTLNTVATTEYDDTTFEVPFYDIGLYGKLKLKSYTDIWRVIHDNIPGNRSIYVLIYVNHPVMPVKVWMKEDNYHQALLYKGIIIKRCNQRRPMMELYCASCYKLTEYIDPTTLIPLCNESCRFTYTNR